MEEQRYSRWVNSSYALAGVETFFIVILAQQLGKLDVNLIIEDKRFFDLPQASRESIEEADRLNDRFVLSYLWVLGSYELIRTWRNRVKDRIDPTTYSRIDDVYEKFRRVRIPLAKMEAAKGYETIDSSIAFPALHKDLGISWQLSETTYVSRRELSDSLLGLLESMRP